MAHAMAQLSHTPTKFQCPVVLSAAAAAAAGKYALQNYMQVKAVYQPLVNPAWQ
jgi:hypothetical protein